MDGESEAVRLLRQASAVVGLDLGEKERLKKKDPRKEVVAWFLRKKTPMGLEWIAGKLEMGNRANVSRAFRNVEDTKDVTVRKWKRELQKMYGCAH